MKTVGSILAALVLFSLAQGPAVADDKKIDTAKLIGRWEFTTVDGKDVKDTELEAKVVEFAWDRKTFEWKILFEGREIGPYKIEKEKIKVLVKNLLGQMDFKGGGGGPEYVHENWTIKSITDDSLTLFFERAVLFEGKTADFKKVGGKTVFGHLSDFKTLEGTITCAKCDLKKETACATVIVVKENGKEVVYYLDKDWHKMNHKEICQSPKEGVVTGAVGKDGDKHTIEVASFRFK